MHWDDVKVFLAVARTGTLTTAAEKLNLGIATVSRRLERLEQDMAMTLFTRHQTGYQLTLEGEALLSNAEAFENAALSLTESGQNYAQAQGLVRLAVSENLANGLVIPSLQSLFSRHPELRIEINSGVQLTNLHRRDADLAIRTIQPDAGNLTIKRLGTLRFGLYAATSYMKFIQDNDLQPDQYHYVGWADTHQHLSLAHWMKDLIRNQNFKIETNSLSTQIDAVKSGLGIGLLPDFIANQSGLVQINKNTLVEQPIWLVVHSNLITAKRIRTVMDHLIQLFTEHPSFQ